MAKITSTSEEKVYKISEWLGLNENPDGDTRLKLGEAAAMRNFKITRDGSLQKRPGLGSCFVGGEKRYFLRPAGNDAVISTSGKTLSVYSNVSVDMQTGEVEYGESVTLDADSFSWNQDVSKYVAINSEGKLCSIYSVAYAGGAYRWQCTPVSVTEIPLTSNYLTEYSYKIVSGSTVWITTSEPTLEVYESATLDVYTGEIFISKKKVVISYGFSSAHLKYFLFHDGKYFQVDLSSRDEITGGYKWRMHEFATAPEKHSVEELWSGYVGGKYRVVARTYRHFWEVVNEEGFVFKRIGSFVPGSDVNVSFFGYTDKLYAVVSTFYYGEMQHILYCWGGKGAFESVLAEDVYVPVVSVSVSPTSGTTPSGSLLERINLLSPYRRVWISPEANTSDQFFLPEKATSILSAKSLVSGESLGSGGFVLMEVDKDGHSVQAVKLNSDFLAKNIGINTIEICYRAEGAPDYGGFSALFPSGGKISAEQYNGASDSRLFLCCDRDNKIYYSGLDYDGRPRADYFPDLNVISVGDSSDNITGLIRHYSRLIVYKANSTYSIQYGTIGLADGTTTAAFYCTPINKRLGNDAFGQVRLVLNSPRTLHGRDLYEWRNNTSYSSNLSVDERQAKRISDRIHKTLSSFDFSQCYCYDDNDNQEYYICYDKKALVHNYAVDAWYYYDNFDVTCMVNFGGELYAGDSQGRFNLISRENRTDNGEEITACWESGSEPFGRDFMRKYSAMMWIGIKPELRSQVDVTVRTDRSGNLAEKTVAASLATFEDADFRDWSFNTSRMPQMSRLKIKAKKFVYYKLIFEMSGENTTATIVSADVRVRFTGYAR